jgi:hypothetical protein
MPLRKGLDELRKHLPLPTTGAAEKAFTTYKNYLTHIDSCLGGEYGVGGSLIFGVVTALRSTSKLRSIQRRKVTAKQHDAIGRALTIAWAKELRNS